MDNIYALTDSQIQKKTGEKIKATRLKQNITQEKLAEDSLVSRSSIKKFEAGEIGSFDTLVRILRTLGMLDSIRSLCEPEQMSPNEYYEMVHSINRHKRKRATKTHITKNVEEEAEW